jgi:hypothetical protein
MGDSSSSRNMQEIFTRNILTHRGSQNGDHVGNIGKFHYRKSQWTNMVELQTVAYTFWVVQWLKQLSRCLQVFH